MNTAVFTYLGAKCEYDFETKNLHIISKQSFNSPKTSRRYFISKKHNIEKKDIKSITFKYHHTKLPSKLCNYFVNYPNLEYIELEKLDFKNVETIDEFINQCPRLKEIIITNKEALKLRYIKDLINHTEHTKSIIIKHINAPNLQEVNGLLWYIKGNIKNITIEDITAPNINTVNNLIYGSSIESLNLTKIGNVNVNAIHTLIRNCLKLKTLEMKPLTNTEKIDIFINNAPILETDIISKINKVENLNPYFLIMTPKNEVLDLNKFKNIKRLALHIIKNLNEPSYSYQHKGIKIGSHQIKLIDYVTILVNNIPIIDKTEEEIIKEIINQSKAESEEDIQNFLEKLENKKILKNEEYQKQLKSKLTIIKNLK